MLFYETTEGGAGVLTRLANEPDALAQVARQALQVMHYDVPAEGAMPDFEALSEQDDVKCVAGCYRCLLSYYNQPDHELIDRRDPQALRTLWRLAQVQTELQAAADTPVPSSESVTQPGWSGQWLHARDQHAASLPLPATAQVDACTVLHWPDHYAAIALPDTPRELQSAWEERGYTFIRFPADPETWTPLFQRLARLLGH